MQNNPQTETNSICSLNNAMSSLTIEDSPPSKLKIGYCFDERMLLHKDFQNKHQECPERAMTVYLNILEQGIANQLIRVFPDDPKDEDILSVHTQAYYDLIKSLQFDGKGNPRSKNETKKSLKEKDSYDNFFTYDAAMVAAGSLMATCRFILQNKLDHAFAIIRPPGHHADTSSCKGFCIFNSVAIATEYIHKTFPKVKVAIIDWDVHHGDGTQKIFYNKSDPLFISIHRHDKGTFYPYVTGFAKETGEGEGIGRNVNIPIDTKGTVTNGACAVGDAEYIAIFDKIVMNIVSEYEPDVVIVSCGFDAGENDVCGKMKCTPIAYAYMTKRLMMMGKKIIFALEGGYTLDTLKRCSESVFRTMLGEKRPFEGLMAGNYANFNQDMKFDIDLLINNYGKIYRPIGYVCEEMNDVIKIQKEFWKCFKKDSKKSFESKKENILRISDHEEVIKQLGDLLNDVLVNEKEFNNGECDYIMFKIGKVLLNPKKENEENMETYFTKLKWKIKSIRSVQHELGFNIEGIHYTKLRSNATKQQKLLNWTRSEMKYDLDPIVISEMLTLLFQHLSISTSEIVNQLNDFISKIKSKMLNSKIIFDLYNTDLIIIASTPPPDPEPEKKEEGESGKKKRFNKFKAKQKPKINLSFGISGIKKKNINILTLSEQIVENNFINGLESLSHYISENVMN